MLALRCAIAYKQHNSNATAKCKKCLHNCLQLTQSKRSTTALQKQITISLTQQKRMCSTLLHLCNCNSIMLRKRKILHAALAHNICANVQQHTTCVMLLTKQLTQRKASKRMRSVIATLTCNMHCVCCKRINVQMLQTCNTQHKQK